MTSNCTICGRKLETEGDPLSIDCGGDCWGCIGEIEADGGYPQSLEQVRNEFKDGHRISWIPSPSISLTPKGIIRSGEYLNIHVSFKMPLGQPRKKEDIFIRYISKSSNGMVERRELQKFTKTTDKNGSIYLKFKYPKLWLGNKAWIEVKLESNTWSFPLFVTQN